MRMPKTETVFFFGFWPGVIGLFAMIIMNIRGVSADNIYMMIARVLFSMGVFIASYALVHWQLMRFGLRNFGFSAFVAIFGFILVYLPVLSILLDVQYWWLKNWVKTVLVVFGIVLIVFSLLTEHFDLNQRITEQIINLGHQLKLIVLQFNWKRLYHPSNVLTLLGITLLSLRYFDVTLQGVSWRILWAGFIGFFLVNLVLQFPAESKEIIMSLGSLIKQMGLYFVEGVKSLPHAIVLFFQKTYRAIIDVTVFVFHNDYVLLPLFGGLSFITLPFSLEVKLGIVFLSLMIALFRLTVVNPHLVREGLMITRSQAYKFSTKIRTISFKKQRCQYCGKELPRNASVCPHCGKEQHRDLVSNTLLKLDDVVRQCPNCHHYGNIKYLDTWLSQRPICPYCKKPFRPIDSRARKLSDFIKPERDRIRSQNESVVDVLTKKVKTMIMDPTEFSNAEPTVNKKTSSGFKGKTPEQKKVTFTKSWTFSKSSKSTNGMESDSEGKKQKDMKKVISEEGKKAAMNLGAKALSGTLTKEAAKEELKRFAVRLKEEIDEENKTKKKKK